MTDFFSRLKGLKGDQSFWFLLTVIAVILAYSTTVSGLFSVWWEEGSAYSHGLLLVVISIYLFARHWYDDRDTLSLGLHLPALLILLLCIPLWLASHLIFVQSAEQFFFLIILFFLFPTLLGVRPSLKYLFPVILLLVAVPVWGVGIGALQLLTTIVSAFLLKLSGITSIRDGFFILVPAGTFEVEAACTGLRYQLAGMSISLLYAYLTRIKILPSIVFLCSSVAVVFLANVTRIYIVIVVGEMTGMKSPLVEDHVWLGWLIFAIYISLFLWAAERWIPKRALMTEEQPVVREASTHSGVPVNWGLALSLVLIICLSGPILAVYFSVEKYKDQKVTLVMPEGIADGWVQSDKNRYDLHSVYPQANAGLSGSLGNDRDERVQFQLFYYLYQKQGHEAINQLNRVADEADWQVLEKSTLADVQEIQVRDRGGRRVLVWLWYRTNNKSLANDKQAKLENFWGLLKDDPSISVNIISTEILEGKERARRLLRDFVTTQMLDHVVAR